MASETPNAIGAPHPLLLRRAAAAGAGLCIAAIAVLSLLPHDAIVRTGAPKVLEHAAAYGGTAMLLVAAVGGRWRHAAVLLTALIAVAALLEYAQRWSPGRDPGWDTLFGSVLGVVLGTAVAVVAGKAVGHVRRTRATS